MRNGHYLLWLVVVLIVAGLVMRGAGELVGTGFIIVFDLHPPVGILGGNFGNDLVAFRFVGGDGDKSIAEFVELPLGISFFNSV